MQADVKRRLLLGGALSLALPSRSMAAQPAPSLADWLPPSFRRPAAFVVATRDTLLASLDADLRRQPASLAKLAAAIVALEALGALGTARGRLADVVNVSAAAAAVEGTRLGLRAANRVSAEQLLSAMLIGSANDACLALAEHVAGSARAFVERMNRLAASLGMRDTHFIDPCGLDRPGQHSTAADLLKLARRALEEPQILQRAERDAVRVELTDSRGHLVMRGTNALLNAYDGAFGLKTGYTRQAGPCLIGAARRGDTEALVVILGCKDRWPVSVALLDEAFERLGGIPRVRSRATVGEPDS